VKKNEKTKPNTDNFLYKGAETYQISFLYFRFNAQTCLLSPVVEMWLGGNWEYCGRGEGDMWKCCEYSREEEMKLSLRKLDFLCMNYSRQWLKTRYLLFSLIFRLNSPTLCIEQVGFPHMCGTTGTNSYADKKSSWDQTHILWLFKTEED